MEAILMKLLQLINRRLKEKYWYSERMYQYVVNGIIGWSVTVFLFILWIIKWYILN